MKRGTGHLLMLVMLLMNSVTDLKKREILLKETAAFFLAGLVLSFLNVIQGMPIVAALMAGGTAAGMSLLSAGRIGMGDALVILTLCVYLPAEEVLGMLSAASVLSAGAGICLLVRGAGKDTQIPFVPFLLVGAIVIFFLTGRSI